MTLKVDDDSDLIDGAWGLDRGDDDAHEHDYEGDDDDDGKYVHDGDLDAFDADYHDGDLC